MVKIWKYFLGILVLILSAGLLALAQSPDEKLHLIACDVGQGDAILAIYGSTQVLIDGGPGSDVIECLSEYIPFTDRKIEAIILTHPQKDHYGGLLDVLNSYEVGAFISTPLDSGSQEWQVLKSEVGGRGIRVINPKDGLSIRLGMIYLDILHPTQKFLVENFDEGFDESGVLGAYTTSRDPNDFSVVVILRFEEFDALLTGDIGPEISDNLAETILLRKEDIEYIKIPHHGSKNGLSSKLLDAVSPQVAVISAGKNNSYGHPHQEIIKMLSEQNIEILRTDEMGDVQIVSTGNEFRFEE